jgi:hypothetical protein
LGFINAVIDIVTEGAIKKEHSRETGNMVKKSKAKTQHAMLNIFE